MSGKTHVTGSTKVIRASRGPISVRDPRSERSKPSLDILLYTYVSQGSDFRGKTTNVMLATVKVKDAPSTRFWAMGAATAPMRYKAVLSVCFPISITVYMRHDYLLTIAGMLV